LETENFFNDTNPKTVQQSRQKVAGGWQAGEWLEKQSDGESGDWVAGEQHAGREHGIIWQRVGDEPGVLNWLND